MQKVSLQILVITENKTIQNLYLILIMVHWAQFAVPLVFRELCSLGNNHRNSDKNAAAILSNPNVMDGGTVLLDNILENIQGGDVFLLKHYF